MKIRQLRGAATAALIAVLTISACTPSEAPTAPGDDLGSSADSGAQGSSNPEKGIIGAELSVDSDFGEKPELTWPDTEDPADLAVEVLHEGDGETVADGAHVVAHYEGYVWQHAEPFDSTFLRGGPTEFPLDRVIAGWSQTIPGHKVGSRLLITIPPDMGYGPGGNPRAGIGGEDTLVFVVDLISTFTADAMGDAEAEPIALPESLPVSIDHELGQRYSVEVAKDAPEPQEPGVYPLSKGAGKEVAAGDKVVVAYSLTSWDNEISETSWDTALGPEIGPQTVVVGQGTGMDLLAGQSVGSRVMLIQIASGDLPPLVIVADILAAF